MFAGEGASRFSDTAARLPPLSFGARALVTALTPGNAVTRLRRSRTREALYSVV